MDTRHINIIIERNVPFIAGLLEPYANVRYLAADDITPEAVRGADAMIIRTRTRCDAALLLDSRCTFIASATIGLDHVDLEWCRNRGITVTNAPGCNAPAVAQYVMASVMRLANRPVAQYKIGIVGVGHVGSIIERWARGLDMEVMVCDPPRQRAEGGDGWSTLDEIAERCDIITFHTPLTAEGPDATHHIAGKEFFESLRRAPMVINSARGQIVDTPALVEAIDNGLVGQAVIDCWEGEPDISRELLERAVIATPHIAGYSHDGKVRATQMALDSLTGYFGLPRITVPMAAPRAVARTVSQLAVIKSYNPLADTAKLKASPDDFESLRNAYAYRSEVGDSHND